MKTAIIINPTSGRGKTKKIWPRLRDLIQKQIKYEEHWTNGPGHASRLALELEKKGIEQIIVAGGDGTLHEVINGLDRKELILGAIPTGTGNDFCRSVGVPTNPQRAAKILWKGRVQRVDIGRVNDKFFINVAGVGFDAQVAEEINNKIKWLSGTPAYLAAIIKLILTYSNIPLKMVLEDSTEINLKSFLLAIGNAQYYGGGMRIVPSAVLDDGYLHICAAGDVKRFEVLTTLPKVFSGKHTEHPLVKEYKAREIELVSDYKTVIHADGEIIGHLPAKFSILPGRLKFLVPR